MKSCIHHWLIQQARGPTSHGECKFCHATREFSNSIRQWYEKDHLPTYYQRMPERRKRELVTIG